MKDELKLKRMIKAQESLALLLERNANDLRNPEKVDVNDWDDELDMIEATLNNIRFDCGVELYKDAGYFFKNKRPSKFKKLANKYRAG